MTKHSLETGYRNGMTSIVGSRSARIFHTLNQHESKRKGEAKGPRMQKIMNGHDAVSILLVGC